MKAITKEQIVETLRSAYDAAPDGVMDASQSVGDLTVE